MFINHSWTSSSFYGKFLSCVFINFFVKSPHPVRCCWCVCRCIPRFKKCTTSCTGIESLFGFWLRFQKIATSLLFVFVVLKNIINLNVIFLKFSKLMCVNPNNVGEGWLLLTLKFQKSQISFSPPHMSLHSSLVGIFLIFFVTARELIVFSGLHSEKKI